MKLEDRLYLGDCRDVLGRVPDHSVDFILTDPPYLVNYESSDGRTIKGDQTSEWLVPAFAEMHRVLKDNSFCISFYGWGKVDLFFAAWRNAGFRPVGHFVFIKRYSSSKRKRILRYHHEQAYLLVKGTPKQSNFPLRDVQPFEYTGNKLHPNEKPVHPLRRLVGAFTKPDDLVLDPFAGSGSCLLAAWQMSRKYLGIEADWAYYKIARDRLRHEQSRIAYRTQAISDPDLIEEAPLLV